MILIRALSVAPLNPRDDKFFLSALLTVSVVPAVGANPRVLQRRDDKPHPCRARGTN